MVTNYLVNTFMYTRDAEALKKCAFYLFYKYTMG